MVEFFCDWPADADRSCPIQVFEWLDGKMITGSGLFGFELSGTFVSWDGPISISPRTFTLYVNEMESKAFDSLENQLNPSISFSRMINVTRVRDQKDQMQLQIQSYGIYDFIGEPVPDDISKELGFTLTKGVRVVVGGRIYENHLGNLYFSFCYVKRLHERSPSPLAT